MGKQAAIVGAGLAGAFCAHSLFKAGFSVTVFDSAETVASLASGNAIALASPYISDQSNPSNYSRFLDVGFSQLENILESLPQDLCNKTGALQIPSTERMKRLLSSNSKALDSSISIVSSQEASHISGITVENDCFWLKRGLLCNPRKLVVALLDSIEVRLNHKVLSLKQENSYWELQTTAGSYAPFDLVVVAAAHEASKFSQLSHLPLEPVRGETLLVESTSESSSLKTAICYDGYIAPACEGRNFIGASFRHRDFNPDPDQSAQMKIFESLRANLPILDSLTNNNFSSRVCFRTSTHDRLPYVGRVPNWDSMIAESKKFRSGSDIAKHVAKSNLEGLFVSLGHGSKGLISCPLAAEIITQFAMNTLKADLGSVTEILAPSRINNQVMKIRSSASR